MEVRDEVKNVHPFFGKRIKIHDDLSKANPMALAVTNLSDDSTGVHTHSNERVGRAKKGASKSSLDKPTTGSNGTIEWISSTTVERNADLIEVDPNQCRRKRQKSDSPDCDGSGYKEIGSSEKSFLTLEVVHNTPSDTTTVSVNTTGDQNIKGLAPQGSCQPFISTSAPSSFMSSGIARRGNLQSSFLHEDDSVRSRESSAKLDKFSSECADTASDSSATPPGPRVSKTKILRLNTKTGTIGSPPPKKPSRLASSTNTVKRTGKSSVQSQSVIVAIKYGHDRVGRASIGRNIDDILSGLKTFPFIKATNPQLARHISEADPPKLTHPFFLGKTAPKVPISSISEQSNAEIAKGGKGFRPRSSMTLGEAKSHSPVKRQIYGAGSGAFHQFGNTTKVTKFPGAIDACWPPKEMIHVRGQSESAFRSSKLTEAATVLAQKKSKYTAAETLAKDDILKITAAKLDIGGILNSLEFANLEDFTDPGRLLRVPLKHFENGCQIQRRVRRELSVKLPLYTAIEDLSDSEDELHSYGRKNPSINPALLKLYKSLPSSLTAFDQSQYETQSWIQKYSPCAAAEVLQCGREAFIIKEWLQSLTITAVDSGTVEDTRSRATSVASRRSRMSNTDNSGKKKRKSSKLEGFVISSEEEDDQMDEISEPEEGNEESHRFSKRSLVRSGDTSSRSFGDSKKLKNAIVISGPSGCGKTAMVYAIAKELGFEVFEINPNGRRGGKDILERVGDMTRNHLVRGSDHPSPPNSQNEDQQSISDAFQADLKSGRQGTMKSFFEPKNIPNSTINKATSKVNEKIDADGGETKSSKVPPKQQKQSLILFEEVDVIYEEDKQFWTTVISLIAQSKRPIIMTCNDERLVPLQALELHAIIRLSPPPSDVAIDYMLLVAAAEGHIIKRRAVKALYEVRQFDLRATLTELDYWCQLGIGDRRGGLDWLYPRWPPGCDVDRDGHKIRVVSEGTYKTGLGWMSRDLVFEHCEESDVKEQVLREVWGSWNIDIGDWHEALEISSLLENSTEQSKLSSLLSYEAFTESMSVADICACRSFATGNEVCIDASAPTMTTKARNDFTIGYELLQADPVVSYDTLDIELAIYIKSRSRQLLQLQSQSKSAAPSEEQVIAKIAAVGCGKDDSISRQDFSIAFDSIAEPERNTMQSASSLEASIFDRTTSMIAVDVAPFVRSIVAYDAKLQQERARLSNLLSEGGRKGKRLRTTRSALSALEGGARNTTRPEKYFRVPLNPHLVYRTGLQSWQDALYNQMSEIDGIEPPLISEGLGVSSPAMSESS